MAELIENKRRELVYLDNMDGVFVETYSCSNCNANLKDYDWHKLKKMSLLQREIY